MNIMSIYGSIKYDYIENIKLKLDIQSPKVIKKYPITDTDIYMAKK